MGFIGREEDKWRERNGGRVLAGKKRRDGFGGKERRDGFGGKEKELSKKLLVQSSTFDVPVQCTYDSPSTYQSFDYLGRYFYKQW